MLTPSLVLAYWICGSMAGILYASGLSLSRCHWMDRAISRRLVRQRALATAWLLLPPAVDRWAERFDAWLEGGFNSR